MYVHIQFDKIRSRLPDRRWRSLERESVMLSRHVLQGAIYPIDSKATSALACIESARTHSIVCKSRQFQNSKQVVRDARRLAHIMHDAHDLQCKSMRVLYHFTFIFGSLFRYFWKPLAIWRLTSGKMHARTCMYLTHMNMNDFCHSSVLSVKNASIW